VEAKVIGDDTGTGDQFSRHAVDLHLSRLAAGANLDDPHGYRSGSAYYFEWEASNGWVQQAKLAAPDGSTNDFFGERVLIGSGGRLYVSAPWNGFAGAVYVFERVGEEWVQAQKLEPQGASLNADFGFDIAIEGDVFVGGAPDQIERDRVGGAFVFERGGDGVWRQTAKLLASDGEFGEEFGWSVAVRGDLIAVGAQEHTVDRNAPGHGAVYIFRRGADGAWREETQLIPPAPERGDKLGSDLVIIGDLICAGARGSATYGDGGSVFVFRDDGPGRPFNFVKKFRGHDTATTDRFGYFLDVDWPYLVVGSPNHDGNWEDSGAAYIFELERCGDIDGDGDVDLDDHARFHECISGPSGGVRALCATADLDRDDDVDLSDYRFLQHTLADAE
jgi:hypothetical protein